eukprot:CAMPEP_0171813486 /NCGR_PEP_ID=MMETSP0991-20121206/79240_1 /TAXON_ID=483369 /ORGANISM="non described non described, Strain CCMP2098" /LENGTH=721 /DNA_ID=CAMNT_0012427069 /DNA_START=131 /DNA_END=2297 /DNA_ORIENTATION=+
MKTREDSDLDLASQIYSMDATEQRFASQIYSMDATEQCGGVDFLRYENTVKIPSRAAKPQTWQTDELLVYLPGLDFTGLSAVSTFPALSSEFDLWWCRVGGADRTQFVELADTITDFICDKGGEHRPVTILGESFGGLLALGVAQRLLDRRNVNLRGVVVVNAATSFNSSPWGQAGPLLASLPTSRLRDLFPTPVQSLIPPLSVYSAVAGAVLALTVPDTTQVVRSTRNIFNEIIGGGGSEVSSRAEKQSQQLFDTLDSLATRLGPETLQFRLNYWLKDGCEDVNPKLSMLANKVPVLVLAGEEDRMLPSSQEASRLLSILGKTCTATILAGVGHAALFDDRLDLLSLIGNSTLFAETHHVPEINYVSDFERPNATTLERAASSLESLRTAVSPIFISTDANGRAVPGLRGVPLPSEVGRPVLLVGNHQLFALDLGLLIYQFLNETGTLPRGLAHPAVFGAGAARPEFDESTAGDFSPGTFRRELMRGNRAAGDVADGEGNDGGVAFAGVGNFREFGAVPVSPRNFFNLMKENEMALLFPGGVREANHGRGEDYKLFWTKKPDFVRVASRFNAIIVPFGAVGAADSLNIVADSSEMQSLPFIGDRLREQASAIPAARRAVRSSDEEPENFGFPLALPSSRGPDRFYFRFGKPFDTQHLDHRDKGAVEEAYSVIKSDVEGSIEYLLKEREKDPYRELVGRLAFERINARQAPGFPLAKPPYS